MEKLSKISIRKFIKGALVDPDELVRLIQEHGDIITFTLPGARLHIMAKPEHIKHVFFSHSKNYIRDPNAYKGFNDFFHHRAFESLTEWKKDKDILGKLLTKEKMKAYVGIMSQTISDQLDTWKQFADSGKPVVIDKLFSQLGLQNVRNTLLGGIRIDTNLLPQMTRELFHFVYPSVFFKVKLFGRIPLPSPLYFKYKKVVKQWEEIADAIVKESFADYVNEDNAIKYTAKNYGFYTYDKLTEDMKEHLRSIAVASIVAGNDSTDGTLLQIGIMLSLYPMVTDKLREEVKSVLGSRLPTYDDLEKLLYVRAMIKEILRLDPPMTIAPRTCLNDDIIAGSEVKKGDIVVIPSYAVQRDARYWKNPVGFDPSRFLEPLSETQRLVYMPFSLGERSCLGAQYAMVEISLILAQIIQRYRFELSPGCSLDREPGLENRLNTEITMKIYSNSGS